MLVNRKKYPLTAKGKSLEEENKYLEGICFAFVALCVNRDISQAC